MALRETAGDRQRSRDECGRGVAAKNEFLIWGEDELIQILQEKAKELGRVPRLKDFSVGSPSAAVFYQVFGSWNKALKAAGFVPNRTTKRQGHRGIDKDECARTLRRLSEALDGARPTMLDVASPAGISAGCPTVRTITRLFGSFRKALEYAGLNNLPSRRELLKQGQENTFAAFFDRITAGRKFLLRSEIPLGNLDFRYRYFRKYAEEKGIVIIPAKPGGAVKVVMDWLRGIEAEGCLPGEKEIAEKMGERAFGYLMRVISGETMQDIGVLEGITRERVRQIINRKAQKAVKAILGDKKAKCLTSYAGSQIARTNNNGVTLVLLARVNQNLKQENLASMAGLTCSTVSRVEQGYPVRYKTAKKIAEALNLNMQQLFVDAKAKLSNVKTIFLEMDQNIAGKVFHASNF